MGQETQRERCPGESIQSESSLKRAQEISKPEQRSCNRLENGKFMQVIASSFKLPPDYKKHAITFLTFYGKEKLSTQENLLEVINQFPRRFIVDSNIDWTDLSVKTENEDIAFILGTTVDRETSPLRLMLEDCHKNPKVRKNVFMFGMKSPTREDEIAGHRTPLLIISKLDEFTTKLLDMEQLRKFDKPGGDKTKWDSSESITDEKDRVLSLLNVNDVEEVSHLTDRELKNESLRLRIEQERSKCFARFWESNDVARLGYARLLLGTDRESRDARKEFVEKNYPNVFGDFHLIQNALFFSAEILSKDKGVQKMARLCGLKCLENP